MFAIALTFATKNQWHVSLSRFLLIRESSTPHLPVVVRAYAKAMRFDWFLTTPITAQLVVYSRGLADCKISTWAAIRLPLQANYAEGEFLSFWLCMI